MRSPARVVSPQWLSNLLSLITHCTISVVSKVVPSYRQNWKEYDPGASTVTLNWASILERTCTHGSLVIRLAKTVTAMLLLDLLWPVRAKAQHGSGTAHLTTMEMVFPEIVTLWIAVALTGLGSGSFSPESIRQPLTRIASAKIKLWWCSIRHLFIQVLGGPQHANDTYGLYTTIQSASNAAAACLILHIERIGFDLHD
jgi:hypothetical protein